MPEVSPLYLVGPDHTGIVQLILAGAIQAVFEATQHLASHLRSLSLLRDIRSSDPSDRSSSHTGACRVRLFRLLRGG